MNLWLKVRVDVFDEPLHVLALQSVPDLDVLADVSEYNL